MTFMKKSTATFLAGVAFASQVVAADITPQGADELKTSMTRYLPKDIVDTGFLKVNVQTGKYEISIDWNALVDIYKDPSFTINGLSPLSIFASPVENGEWKVDGSMPLNVNGTFKAADKINNFAYVIGAYDFTGIYDPSISFMKSSTSNAKDIKFQTKTDTAESTGTFATMASEMTATAGASGALDVASTSEIAGMVQSIQDPSAGTFEMKVDKINTKVNVLGTKLKEVIAIINFVLEHKQKDKLSDEESQAFKALLRAGLPFWNNLEETVDLNNVDITTAMGNGSLAKLGFGFRMTGATNDANVGFTTTIEKPVPPEGLFPPAYIAAVPTETFLDVSLPNFHAADAANMMIDKFDFNKAKAPPSPEDDKAMGEAFLGGEIMHVVLNKMTAKSDVYDLELSGDMAVNVNQKDKVTATMTLLAKDIDKTVAFLQQNADTVPEYGQAAFFAQMFKGFAVKNDDGRDKWVVEVAENNSVKINGTPFGGQK